MVGKKISVKVTDLAGHVETSEATAEVEKDLPELENVLQESSNQILLMFDTDASEIETSDIVVERAEDELVNPVEKIELLDPTTILATLSSVLIDDTLYNVTVGADSTSFTASVGEVASIEILTTEAEVNKPTKIDYRLLDKNGVDVTKTQKLKETVLVEITGTYKTAKTSDPTDISVTMGAVDDECEVTISYNKGTGSDDSVAPKTQKIKCVGPTATKGTIKYCRPNAGEINKNSGCAKFYLDGIGTTGKVTVGVGEDTSKAGNTPVHFAAFDDSGAAIEYDQYEVESANEAIVAATVRNDASSGKYALIDLVGNEPGTTQVKVIATNNTVSKEYYMTVVVKDIEDMVKVILSDKRNRSLSNAYDVDYTDVITAKIIDDNGDKDAHFETIEWDLVNKDNYKVAKSVPEGLQGKFGWASEPADKEDTEVAVKAWGAAQGTYTVKATVDIRDTKIPQTLKINVKELPAQAWVGAAEEGGQKLTYMVEVGNPTINNVGETNAIKFYALANGLFAGYVRQATDVIAAGAHGAGKVVISNAWVTAKTNPADATVASAAALFSTNVDSTKKDIADLATTANAATDADTVFKTITLYAADHRDLGTYSLKQYTYGTIPTAAALNADTPGAYWVAQPGEAKAGGAITIGDSDPNPDDDTFVGTVKANDASTIANGSLRWTLKFGNKKLATQELYNYLNRGGAPTDKTIDFYVKGITADPDRAIGGNVKYLTYIANDKTYDYDIARAGRYDIELSYNWASTVKPNTSENEFNVKDVVSAYVPKVTLLTKTTADYSLTSFKDIINLNVDLNNNDGLAESLVEPGLMTKWDDKAAYTKGKIDEEEMTQISSDDKYAKYAVVEETVTKYDIPIYFFVPVGSNINED